MSNKYAFYLLRTDNYCSIDIVREYSLRQGNFIAVLDVKFMKKMNPDYLKKVIGKIKKTSQAINGDIAGIGDNFIVATPPSVAIYRSEKNKNLKN